MIQTVQNICNGEFCLKKYSWKMSGIVSLSLKIWDVYSGFTATDSG